METRRYYNRVIGGKVIPSHEGIWDKNREYDPLSDVYYQGNTYRSKKNVPIGIDITNKNYWIISAEYNEQLEIIKDSLNSNMSELKTSFDNFKSNQDLEFKELLNNHKSNVESYIREQTQMLEEEKEKLQNGTVQQLQSQLLNSFYNITNSGVNGVEKSNYTGYNLTDTPSYEPVYGNCVDETIKIQQAIDYCITNNRTLALDGNKFYSVTDTLVVNGTLRIEGNGALIISNIEDKSKPLFKFNGNNNGTFSNLFLYGNLLCKCAIEFDSKDSQAFTLNNTEIRFFRYGIYTDKEESCNRFCINQCNISSNILGGLYLNCGGINNQGKIAPCTIMNTIFHGNLFTSVSKEKYSGQYKIITNEKESEVSQIYLNGVGGLSIIGGQITSNITGASKALIWGTRCSELTIISTDTEQFTLSKLNSEDDYKDYIGQDYGGIIHIEKSRNINIFNSGAYFFNADCFVKLVNCYGSVNIFNIYKENCLFSIDLTQSNYNYLSSKGSNQLFINTNLKASELSPKALSSIKLKEFIELSNISYLKPYMGADYIFNKSENNGIEYKLGYVNPNDPNFSECCYIKKQCNSPSAVLLIAEINTYVNEVSGRYYIEFYDKDNNRIDYHIFEPTESDKTITSSNRNFRRFVYYPNKDIVPLISYVKYGLCRIDNTSSEYIGADDTIKTNGFKMFYITDSPVAQWLTSENQLDHENVAKGCIEKNMIIFGNSIPNYGYHEKGQICYNSNPTNENAKGWQCIESGTPGTWREL